MTITYRTTGAWGAGKGANLTPAEVDGNFYDLATRVTAVEANPAEPVQIDAITSSGSALTITMDNGDIYGPLTLPTAAFVYRGNWSGSTAYAKNDVIVVSNKLYLVAVAHTSDATFNASRVISGATVYQLMFDGETASVAAVGAVLQSGTHDGITFTYNSVANTITADVTAATYTDEQAQDAVATALAAGSHTGISFTYNDTANTLSAAVSVTQYTDEMAQDATATALANGTHSGISFAYNDAGNAISATVTQVGVNVQEGGAAVATPATTLNFDATNFNVTTSAGIATISASAAAAGGVDVQEGAVTKVSAATTLNFDANKFDVTDVSGVATITTTSAGITRETVKDSSSGTSIDFTGIPANAKQISILMKDVSTNGTSIVIVQVGTSSGFVTTGYLGSTSASGLTSAIVTNGFGTSAHISAAHVRHGSANIFNITGNDWVFSSVIANSSNASVGYGGGSVSLTGTLDRIRITTVNGTDAFDAGSINIFYQ